MAMRQSRILSEQWAILATLLNREVTFIDLVHEADARRKTTNMRSRQFVRNAIRCFIDAGIPLRRRTVDNYELLRVVPADVRPPVDPLTLSEAAGLSVLPDPTPSRSL